MPGAKVKNFQSFLVSPGHVCVTVSFSLNLMYFHFPQLPILICETAKNGKKTIRKIISGRMV
jgi:hypothetical protein